MAYSLVLVDDEDWILSGLQNAIEWEKLGFEVVGAFTNGKTAFGYMKDHPPDALLTDIKMPMQDGISLVRDLREAGLKDLKVVFLSGYDDFSLAQSSLRLGAVDYVLKPSSPEQIEEVFIRIRREMDERRRLETEKIEVSQMAEAGVCILREGVYHGVETGDHVLYIKALERYFTLAGRRENKYRILLLSFEEAVQIKCPDEETIMILDTLKEWLNDQKLIEKRKLWYTESLYGYLCILSDCSCKQAELLKNELEKEIRKKAGRQLLIADSGEKDRLDQLWDVYGTVLEQLLKAEMPENIRESYLKLGNDTALKAAIEDEDRQLAVWYLKAWMLKIERTEKSWCLYLLQVMLYHLSIWLLQNKLEYPFIKQLFDKMKDPEDGTYEEIKKEILAFVSSHMLVEGKENRKNRHLCREIANYIGKNYTEDITLNDLAERFYISSNYLGTLFKRNMGISVREYQVQIRLEQADNLIQSGKFKLYQVAEMVGYSNYEYFRKIYGKYRGRNPSEL